MHILWFPKGCCLQSAADNQEQQTISIFEKAKPPWLERLGIHYHQSMLGNEIQARCWMSCSGNLYETSWIHRKGNHSLHRTKVASQHQLMNLGREEKLSIIPFLFEVNVYTHMHRKRTLYWYFASAWFRTRLIPASLDKSSPASQALATGFLELNMINCKTQQSLPWVS